MTKVKKSEQVACDKPKEKYRIKNWKVYNKALIQRGSLTLWIDEEVLENWYFKGERQAGGLMMYSDSCVECLLAIKSLFRLGFRQTEGFARSIILMLEMEIKVPSYTQLCRRQAGLKIRLHPQSVRKMERESKQGLYVVVDSTGLKVYGEGEWKVRQHGMSKRRTWRKLHLAIDERTNELLAVKLSLNNVDDSEVLKPLLEQIAEPIDKLAGDGAYDKFKVYHELERRNIECMIPPRENAAIWTDEQGNDLLHHPRNKAINVIDELGRAAWKKQSGYHRRSKAEVAMFRYKTLFGSKMYAQKFANQKTEVCIKCACINKFTQLGMPISVKVA